MWTVSLKAQSQNGQSGIVQLEAGDLIGVAEVRQVFEQAMVKLART
jgi:hypothetical protein